MEAVLDVVLVKFEEHYVAWHRQIDALVAKRSPTQKDALYLRDRIPNNLVALGHFFNPLSNPAWLEPLAREGFFDHPPEPQYDEEKGTIGFIGWPQSRYLARMASTSPSEVLQIILAMPDTKNIRIHSDLADAALAMPTQMALQLVPKMRSWVEGGSGLLVPSKLGKLAEVWAKDGQIEPALDMARLLLAVVPDPRPPELIDPERKLFATREPRPKFDVWEYEQIVRNNLPHLVEHGGRGAFEMLCGLLEEAIRLTQPGERRAEDHSRSWRAAIEEHGQNFSSDIKGYLVAAVRDAAEALARTGQIEVPALVKSLRERRLLVFLRLAHHILGLFLDADREHIERTLLSVGMLNRAPRWHEYALLLRAGFVQVSPSAQQRILGAIDRGPNQSKYKQWFERTFGRGASDEEVGLHLKVWTRDRLALVVHPSKLDSQGLGF